MSLVRSWPEHVVNANAPAQATKHTIGRASDSSLKFVRSMWRETERAKAEERERDRERNTAKRERQRQRRPRKYGSWTKDERRKTDERKAKERLNKTQERQREKEKERTIFSLLLALGSLSAVSLMPWTKLRAGGRGLLETLVFFATNRVLFVAE